MVDAHTFPSLDDAKRLGELLHQFLLCAQEVYDFWDGGGPYGRRQRLKVTQLLQQLEFARKAVGEFRERMTDSRDPMRWNAEVLAEDVDRLCCLLSTEDEAGKYEYEVCLLMNSLHENCSTTDETPSLPTDPRALLDELRSVIQSAQISAQSVLDFPAESLPPDRAERLRRILQDDWTVAYSNVLATLDCHVDRYIFPRLGTQPDEWTTRLSTVLDQLARAFGGGQFPVPHVGMVDLPLPYELAERVSANCRELRQLWEQLDSLRLDSLPMPEIEENENSGPADDNSRKGKVGRPSKWGKLLTMADEMPNADDQEVVAAYNKRFGGKRNHEIATVQNLRNARHHASRKHVDQNGNGER